MCAPMASCSYVPPMLTRDLEVRAQVAEAVELKQQSRPRTDVFFLKHPCAGMRDEHRVETRGEGRVHVRLRAVADHPRSRWLHATLGHERAISRRVLLADDG